MRFFWGSSIALSALLVCSAAKGQQPVGDKSSPSIASASKEVPAPARKRRKHVPAVVHDESQNKTVVPEGGAKEPPEQIAPGLAPEEREHERREAQQWLSATDGDLKILADRHLSPQRQDSVKQVRFYLADARSAMKEGDFKRAHTLALKAHLLTDDMVKH